MVLQPFTTNQVNDTINNRIIYILQYKWGMNGISQQDLSDTIQGLQNVGYDPSTIAYLVNPIVGLFSSTPKVVILSFSNIVNGQQGSDGFTVQYVQYSDATTSEKALEWTALASSFVNSIVQTVKTTAQNFVDTFNLSGIWGQLSTWLIIFGILFLILYLWTHRRG